MNRNQVTREQAVTIRDAIEPTVSYLIRLCRRMEQRGFPHNDPLYRDVVAAHDHLNRLRLALHYLAAPSLPGPGAG